LGSLLATVLFLPACGSDTAPASEQTAEAGQPTAPAPPAATPSAAPEQVALADPASGFTASAPAGYALAVREGAYVISDGRAQAAILLLGGAQDPTEAGRALAAQAGAQVIDEAASPAGWSAIIDRGFGPEAIETRSHEGGLLVAVYGPDPAGATADAGPVALGERRLAELRSIVDTVQGGAPAEVAFQPAESPVAPIQLRPFTLADGSASADVPADPGWSVGGRQGTIEGVHPDQGAFAFGVFVPVTLPETPVYPGGITPFVGPYAGPEGALASVLPSWIASCCQATWTDVQTTLVPGTEGHMPGFASAIYRVRLLSDGRPFVGLVSIGTDPSALAGTGAWSVYYSFVLVAEGSPPELGTGLLATWRGAERRPQPPWTGRPRPCRRRASSSGRRNDKANYNWSRYIRGREPILLPIGTPVIPDDDDPPPATAFPPVGG
jgi:hypothetical protein